MSASFVNQILNREVAQVLRSPGESTFLFVGSRFMLNIEHNEHHGIKRALLISEIDGKEWPVDHKDALPFINRKFKENAKN